MPHPSDVARHLLIACFAALIAACSPDPARFAPPEDQALAGQFFATLKRARTAQPGALAVPPGIRLKEGGFRRVADDVPDVTPRLVGFRGERGTRGARNNLTYALDQGSASVLLTLSISRNGARPEISDVNVMKLGKTLDEARKATGPSASPILLALVMMLPLTALAVSIAAIVRVWRSGRFRRRWLATLACLPGIGLLSILWPSGRLFFAPIYLSLLPVGFQQLLFAGDAWRFSATIPVGAIIILLIRRGTRDGLPAAET